MVVAGRASRTSIEEAPLPTALAREAALIPFDAIAENARGRLEAAVPTLAPYVAGFPISVFGLTGGFFYLTSAQGRAWGMAGSVATEVLTLQALGHFHFAFQDLVIDEGQKPTVMCLLSDACLLCYLDGLAALVPDPAMPYGQLHRDYYNSYAAAIVRDLAHCERPRPYSPNDILGLGDKAAPGGTMLHVVADLSGRPECARPAVAAVRRLCTGLQLLDDLHDCTRDIATGNLTWPVTSALLAYPDLDTDDADSVMAAVVGSGSAGACLRLSARAFSDALSLAEQADAVVLGDLARCWHKRAAARIELLDETLDGAGVNA